MYGRPDQDFWDTICFAAIASGRKTAAEAAKMADELLTLRKNAWPAVTHQWFNNGPGRVTCRACGLNQGDERSDECTG